MLVILPVMNPCADLEVRQKEGERFFVYKKAAFLLCTPSSVTLALDQMHAVHCENVIFDITRLIIRNANNAIC